MNRWKALLRGSFARAYQLLGAMWLHEKLMRDQFVTILLFHRVNDLIPEDGLTVSTSRFRQICTLLLQRFHVIPLHEVFRLLRQQLPLPRRTVAITFDDCYADNLQAARILHEFQMPATFFVPTGYVGSTRRFEWDRGLPELPNLCWAQIREMVSLGHEIGSHTVNHVNMGLVSPEVAWEELTASRRTIEDHLGRSCRFFAYPFGGPNHFRPEYLPMIEEAGYEGGLSAFGGFVRPGCDDRLLPREAMPYFKSLSHLELHLSGCLHWWYALRGRELGKVEVPQGFEDRPSEFRSLSLSRFLSANG
jgi:peptidoglycan/xylan/chitin deacetylase (PgdA/CDA1 family)